MKANDPENKSHSSAPLPPLSEPPADSGPAEAGMFFSDEQLPFDVNHDVYFESDTMSCDCQGAYEGSSVRSTRESAGPIALVIPFPFDSYGRIEWRLPVEVEDSLPWEDNARRLRTSAGVLDVIGFLYLRDKVGAWIECDQADRDVAEALRPLSAADWVEPSCSASTGTAGAPSADSCSTVVVS
jgi:hypothetical protein